jgi:hypothetical protein
MQLTVSINFKEPSLRISENEGINSNVEKPQQAINR